MRPNPYFLNEIVGERGSTWVYDKSSQAGTSRRGTPYYGWRKGAEPEPTVWVVEHWLYEPEDGDGQAEDRQHVNRSFEVAQSEGVLGNPLFLQVLDRASWSVPDDTVALVSELASTLEVEMMQRALEFHEVEVIESRIGAALDVLHGLDLVHSDVTPGNIFKVGNDWKLGDLGAALPTGDPIRELPADRAFVPHRYDFGVAADPDLDRGSLSNIVAKLRASFQ
jgi:serine/threonine protein kinase